MKKRLNIVAIAVVALVASTGAGGKPEPQTPWDFYQSQDPMNDTVKTSLTSTATASDHTMWVLVLKCYQPVRTPPDVSVLVGSDHVIAPYLGAVRVRFDKGSVETYGVDNIMNGNGFDFSDRTGKILKSVLRSSLVAIQSAGGHQRVDEGAAAVFKVDRLAEGIKRMPAPCQQGFQKLMDSE